MLFNKSPSTSSRQRIAIRYISYIFFQDRAVKDYWYSIFPRGLIEKPSEPNFYTINPEAS